MLRPCLSTEMRATLTHAINLDDNATVDGVLTKIENYLRQQRSVALHRVKFEERQQQDGESFDDFLIAVKKLAADAELCGTCINERLVTGIISGVSYGELRNKLLALRPFPNLPTVMSICRSDESATKTDADLHSDPGSRVM